MKDKNKLLILGGSRSGKTENNQNKREAIPWSQADDSWRGHLRGWLFVPLIRLKWWWKRTRSMPPNDHKLSDGGAWRSLCRWVERRRRSVAQAVTRGAVRCSAWLGVAVIRQKTWQTKDQLIREMILVTKNLGAKSDLLGTACSYGETLSDEDVLRLLKEWNSYGPLGVETMTR